MLYFFWFDAVEIESRVLVDVAIAKTLRATEGNKVQEDAIALWVRLFQEMRDPDHTHV